MGSRYLNGKIIRPDFTIPAAYSGREKYIEHLGAMDVSDYAVRARQKIIDYMDAGFIINKDVFFTVETSDCPLQPDDIQKFLELYILI